MRPITAVPQIRIRLSRGRGNLPVNRGARPSPRSNYNNIFGSAIRTGSAAGTPCRRTAVAQVARAARASMPSTASWSEHHLRGFAFVHAALRHLHLKYSVDDAGRDRGCPRVRPILQQRTGRDEALALPVGTECKGFRGC